MKPLMPINLKLEISGNLFYNDRAGGWALLRLKKRILDKFPQLKERNPVFYNMIFYEDYEELIKEINKVVEEKQAIPILLWFCK